jgi:mannose-6-phosphate isomerase
MEQLYPLKFAPIYKDKIWGGQKLRTILGKDFGALPNCGESWEISGVKGNESVVASGPLSGTSLPELISKYGERLLGKVVSDKYGNEFPLLIKFIDANDDLSIQVHPDDRLAKERHDSFGKTEMWYIFQADEDASLIAGFNRKLDKDLYLSHFTAGTLKDVLNVEKVKAGDVFFIPAGRVHTIGKGICIAEIQQTSDITYRIYDFDRVDDKGQKRELHVEEALDALDFEHHPEYKTRYSDEKNAPVRLVQCPYFTTSKINLDTTLTRDYSKIDSFVIYICFEGAFNIGCNNQTMKVCKGDSILIPAELKHLQLIPEGHAGILEVSIVPC